MKRAKQFKVLTSVMLGTAITFGGMVSPVLAAGNNSSKYIAVNEDIKFSFWDAQEELTQSAKTPYKKGDMVIYGSSIYQCRRFHYAQPGWNPKEARMFWKFVKSIPTWSAQEELTQSAKTPYEKGELVIYNSQVYKCRRFHYAQPGWNPCDAPMFWQLVK